MLKYLTLLGIFSLLGCQEQKPLIHWYHQKSLKEKPVTCLALQLPQENPLILQTLQSLYTFEPTCHDRLEVSFKEGIVCNSQKNASASALGHFPHSYLKMELHRGFSLLYSYYIDLPQSVEPSDVKEGFLQVKHDLFQK